MRSLFIVAGLLMTTLAVAQTCDRACLNATVDSYLTAMVAHDPSRIAIAKDAKLTENAKVVSAGDGLWKTIDEGPRTFKIYVPDPVAEEVGFLGVIKDSGVYPVLLALRLKVQGRQITEGEILLSRSMVTLPYCAAPERLPDAQRSVCQLRRSVLPNLEIVRPGVLNALPPVQRATRGNMLRIADSYYDSIVLSDGNAAPFADDCVRRENGLTTTSASPQEARTTAALIGGGSSDLEKVFRLGCTAQANTRALSYITAIDRRVRIADPETGLVFGLSMFHRPALERRIRILGVPGVDTISLEGMQPSDRLWAHVFKISGGKLQDIEAVGGIDLPLHSNSGWEEKR